MSATIRKTGLAHRMTARPSYHRVSSSFESIRYHMWHKQLDRQLRDPECRQESFMLHLMVPLW